MWYDELFAPKTWIVNVVVAVITAPIGVYVGILIERFRVRRKYRHLAGLVGTYQLWQIVDGGSQIPTGTVVIHKHNSEVLFFAGSTTSPNESQRAFSGTLVFPHEKTEKITGTYVHDYGDLLGQLEGSVMGDWPKPDLLLTHNYVAGQRELKIKTKWKRI
ncbi:MAG: hypothetical protein ABI432_14585 [Flavobacteriales bacterium]